MNVEINIPVEYREDPIAPDVQVENYKYTYQQKMNNVKDQYDTGTLIQIVMDNMANVFEKALPENAMIVSVAGTEDMLVKKAKFIEALRRHDDQLAVIAFTNQTVKQSTDGQNLSQHVPENNQVSKDVTNKMTTNNIQNDKTKLTNQTQSESEPSHIESNKSNHSVSVKQPCFVDVQTVAHGHYHPVDISTTDIKDDNYVDGIGISKIHRILWKDIKPLIIKHSDLIFEKQSLITLVPGNGSLTANRRATLAKNSGLEPSDITDWDDKLLGRIESEDNFYNVYIICRPESKNADNKDEQLSETSADKLTTVKSPSSSDVTIGQSVQKTSQVKSEEQKMTQQTNNTQDLNSMFKAFVPQNKTTQIQPNVSNMNQGTQTNNLSAQSMQNSESVINEPTSVSKQNNTNDKLLKAVYDKLTTLSEAVDQYQNTADKAFTLAMLANELDTSSLPEQFIIWAKNCQKDDQSRVNGIIYLVEQLQKGTLKQNMPALAQPDIFLSAIEFLAHKKD